MAISTFDGPVRSLNGFVSNGPGCFVNLNTTSTTVTAATMATYAGKIIRLNAATLTVTLPAIVATADNAVSGPGSDPSNLNNQGLTYTFFTEATATTQKIITSTGDFLYGSLLTGNSATAPLTYFPTQGTDVSINMNGTTTGGIIGSYFTVTAIAATKWWVSGLLKSSSTQATPFAST